MPEKMPVTVSVIEAGNSEGRGITVQEYKGIERIGVLNCVARLDAFPPSVSNDGYTNDLFHMAHKTRVDGKDLTCEGVYIAGKRASVMREGRSLTGINKYTDFEYYSAITASVLLNLYPEGHNNIVLGVTHPLDYDNTTREMIANHAKGKYTLTDRNGNKRVYVVTRVIGYSETEGAISYLSKMVDGNIPRFKELLPHIKNGQIISLKDWGHGTYQEIDVVVDGDVLRPNMQTARTHDFGGFVYADMLSRYIATVHKSDVKAMGDRVDFDDRLFDAISTGLYNAFGDYNIDVSEESKRILAQAARDFKQMYDTYSSGRSSSAILWFGGSSKYYAEQASALTFPKGYTWGGNSKLVSDREKTLRYVNLLGIRSEMKNRLLRGDFGNGS